MSAPRMFLSLVFGVSIATFSPILADGPADNLADTVRRVPPPGIEVPEKVAKELGERIEVLRGGVDSFDPKSPLAGLLPDVEFLVKAVDVPLRHQEFQKPEELKVAGEILDLARERLDHLKAGEAPWTREKGLVVRGFRSGLDGSVQPYGLEIPDSYQFDGTGKHRLDFWFHGRGETLTELGFVQQRRRSPGQIRPADAIVLHPYARYSNGNKLAGEIDCLEALNHVREHYRIDDDRVLVRGFSMGGAAVWNLAAHYPDRWMAANPGAGFSETPEFLTVFQGERLRPPWYERKLWHLYDITDHALNFSLVPTVAYSGELDRQYQAAEAMERALKAEGMSLTHVIGADMGHKIDPESRDEIERRLASIESAGRPIVPRQVRFVTWTLRYAKAHWVTLQALEEHWRQARCEARVESGGIHIDRLENVRALTLRFDPGTCPVEMLGPVSIRIAGKELEAAPVASDRSWEAHLVRGDTGTWEVAATPLRERVSKRPGLQGPIDDAFMDSFLFVTPSGKHQYEGVAEFVQRELDHAVTHWRQQFRGEVRIKRDSEVTEEDIARHHLVLWGDPSSNSLLTRTVAKLPVTWTREICGAGSRTFDATHHALLFIQPNPLHPERYVVANSGPTYREYDYLNNARQVPKLPDWAVVDVRSRMTSRGPGVVVAADFFGETWEVKETDVAAEQARVDVEMAEFQPKAVRYWIERWSASEKAKSMAEALRGTLAELEQ